MEQANEDYNDVNSITKNYVHDILYLGHEIILKSTKKDLTDDFTVDNLKNLIEKMKDYFEHDEEYLKCASLLKKIESLNNAKKEKIKSKKKQK